MRAFIIYLPGREHSVAHATYMLDTLLGYGLSAELFAGVGADEAVALAEQEARTLYPFSEKHTKLTEAEIKALIRPEAWADFQHRYLYDIRKRHRFDAERLKKVSYPGVIGCFYSHYNLWKKCVALNEPIMIFEDDVIFYRNFVSMEWDGVLILSIALRSVALEPYRGFLEEPCGTPQAHPWERYSLPSASGYAIKPQAAKKLVKFFKWYFYPADNAINSSLCRIQISNYLMGRTASKREGSKSMTKRPKPLPL